MKEKKVQEQIEKAYIYLVKTPFSNDISVCANKNALTKGDKVIFHTRYGLDLGVVVGSAADLAGEGGGENPCYRPGKSCVCGACGYCHFKAAGQDKQDEDLAYMGEPPHFVFKPYADEIKISDEDSQISQNDDYDSSEKMVEVDGDVVWIERLATLDEIARYKENEERAKEAATLCKNKIAKHSLDMKLVSAHFILCEPKAIFFFTSEERVDFRELVKDLVSVFKMRIELRQIGVRDESRVLGGLAVCGRDFCCHSVSDKPSPVTIKMAKDQDLSLNSTKISGPCGRLLCCLGYEYNFYMEEKASYPSEGTRIKIGTEQYRVMENNILTKKIKLSSTEGGEFFIDRRELIYTPENNRWSVSAKFLKDFLGDLE